MEKILIIEDDETIHLGLKYYLEQESFVVEEVDTCKKTMELLMKDFNFDLILLDINLPDGNGFELFEKIKQIKNIPIIFLTASDLEVSVVRGLDMGADDYNTKPFRARELISRIKSTLRKNNKTIDTSEIHIKNLVIDLKQAKVFKNGIDVRLTALEYKILLTLALNPNTVFQEKRFWQIFGMLMKNMLIIIL